MDAERQEVDVLCVGAAAYDLVFVVDRHPEADEKQVARELVSCGGGPAANAAVTVCRLGKTAAFAGCLGTDPFGQENTKELLAAGVQINSVVRGTSPTPLSVVLAKPGGTRSLVNYRAQTGFLPPGSVDFSTIGSTVILFDGHEPHISRPLAVDARRRGIPVILDAGSVHQGTMALIDCCDHLICAKKFALHYTGEEDVEKALHFLAGLAPTVVITLGDQGLIWRKGDAKDRLPAFSVDAVDTTGAGDVFHGAYAAALIGGKGWAETLRYASAAAALCCTSMGARLGIPSKQEVEAFLADEPPYRGGTI